MLDIMVAAWNPGNRLLAADDQRAGIDEYINNILNNTAKGAMAMLQEVQQWNKPDQQIFNSHTLFTNPNSNNAIIIPTCFARLLQHRQHGKH